MAVIEWSFGFNSSSVFTTRSKKYKFNLFIDIYIERRNCEDKLKNEYLAHAIEQITIADYCITLNSLLTGSISFFKINLIILVKCIFGKN